MLDAVIFLAAGFVGGIVNAAAGGAKLFVFPMLLASGLPPLMANATGTVALWPAQMSAAWVYRRELLADGRRVVRRMLPALLGGLVGALLLIVSTERAFLSVIPFLLAIAVGAILLGRRLPAAMARALPGQRLAAVSGLLLFLCGVYGGYFGAGLGFMLLAVLTAGGAATMQSANAEKNLTASALNTVAVVPLALSGLVSWMAALFVLIGGLAGGYVGAKLARRLPETPMRVAVAGIGLLLTISFLLRQGG
jgi:uncharacterized protein